MASGNSLDVRFTVNLAQMERELRRLQQINDRAARNMAAAHSRAAQQSERAWSAASRQIRQYAGLLAAMFSGREVLQAADTYTRFTNSLKVAGVASYELAGIQENLFQIAQKNGVEIEGLGTLYGRASQSAKELGASQADLLKFTSGVATALRVQGGDAASAQGALLQLSQALASGVIHAEEFNSITEGARPILEAVALGIDRFGGSVAKLRAEVLKGKVSSQEFFQGFLAGSGALEERAAKSVFTVSQGLTALSNAFTKYIGEANASSGITALLVDAMKKLADNLPLIANALLAIAGIYAASFIPGIARATTAIVAQITDAILGAKSFKEAFSDMAKSVIAQLIQMAIRFLIFEAIGRAFGVPGLGRAAIGLGGSKAGNVKVGGLATGTDFFGGGLTMVGESGPELMALPRGAQVLPNGLLRNAVKSAGGGAVNGGGQVFNINTTVNAQDAVLTNWVEETVARGVGAAVKIAQDQTIKKIQRSGRNRLVR